MILPWRTLSQECSKTSGAMSRFVMEFPPALDWLTSGSRPNLIISDIRMPGGRDGIDLAKEVRRFHPNLPIVLVSGYWDHPTDKLSLPVLLKPVSQAALAEWVETVRATSSEA